MFLKDGDREKMEQILNPDKQKKKKKTQKEIFEIKPKISNTVKIARRRKRKVEIKRKKKKTLY